MTRFEASFPGTSGMSYFGFVGVSRRLVKVLPVEVLSLDGLTVPRNASRSLDHPIDIVGKGRIRIQHEDLGDLRSARSSEQNICPGFRNHVRAVAMYPGDGLSPDQSRFCDSWEVPGKEA